MNREYLKTLVVKNNTKANRSTILSLLEQQYSTKDKGIILNRFFNGNIENIPNSLLENILKKIKLKGVKKQEQKKQYDTESTYIISRNKLIKQK